MKIRHGFVSNSSSSSFVCGISGRRVSGYNLGMRDIEMIQCVVGHCMSDKYVVEYIDLLVAKHGMEHVRQLVREHWEDFYVDMRKIVRPNDVVDDVIDVVDDGRYTLPSCFCPMCNLLYISDADILSYILWNSGDTRQDIAAEMRARFVTHDVLRETVKPKTKGR